jgi:thiol-disulfide isomerase/thioredoxin
VGRLPALKFELLIAAALSTAIGCDDSGKKQPFVTKERSQAVLSSSSPAPTTAPAATSAAPPKKPRGPLCAGELEKPPRDMPKGAISRAAAPGVAEQPEKLPAGAGKWTWINFWAAWCVPCKEEMPRLRAWEQKLAGAGKPFRLVFVTIDDDERQLKDFLAAQPASGVRSTYWLREGKEREEFLRGLGFDGEPELPAHVLVDPRGKTRCILSGAIEDADYPQVVSLIGG